LPGVSAPWPESRIISFSIFFFLMGIIIKPVTRKHLECYSDLDVIQKHNDPNDHMIIAQAISDKIPLISSGQKFKCYISQGLVWKI
jgi:PIN domain nuclease of toxin-antitoxin system